MVSSCADADAERPMARAPATRRLRAIICSILAVRPVGRVIQRRVKINAGTINATPKGTSQLIQHQRSVFVPHPPSPAARQRQDEGNRPRYPAIPCHTLVYFDMRLSEGVGTSGLVF